jgi:hypothetical protein
MKMPWQGQSGLEKFITICAVALLISLGLCGVNFIAFIRFVPVAGHAPATGTPEWPVVCS